MINSISKKNKNKHKPKTKPKPKSKTKSKTKSRSKTQKGSGIIYKTPSRYTRIRYTKSKSGFEIKELICFICRGTVFKMRTMKLSTQKKAIVFSLAGVVGNIFNNKFRFFTCTNCGKVEVFSNNISLTETSAE